MKTMSIPFLLFLLITACSCDDWIPDQDPISEKADVDPADSTVSHSLTAEEIVPQLPPQTISYLALGDSYTIGQNVAIAERWPVQLHERINNAQVDVIIEYPDIIATTGWTTQNLSDGMESAGVDTMNYDLVSLLIGVNNQYQGLSIEEYQTEYTDLLERAIQIAGSTERVFVVSIPDYGYTPFGVSNQEEISSELEQFNAVCQEVTQSYNVAWHNITPISQQWPELDGLVASDNLHPSGYQYELWVDSFWQEVLQQIGTN